MSTIQVLKRMQPIRTVLMLSVMLVISLSTVFASSGGITGRTQKSGMTRGCTCHSSVSSSVTAAISGPTTVTPGQVVAETLTVSGGPAIGSGCDIAATTGTLAPVSSSLYLSGTELTHRSNTAMSGGKSRFIFSYTAPSTAQTDTIFATGLSTDNSGDESGDLFNWAPKRIIKVGAAAPIAPTLSSPANGSTNVAVNPTMSWLAVSGATAYELQVSTSNTFTTTVIDQKNLTGASSAISGLANNTLYYWRMNASSTAGTSAWSTAFSFTTVVGLIVPAAPTLSGPANGSTNVSVNPTMTWQAVSGATAYELQISTSNTFTTIAIDQKNLTGTSSAVSGLVNNTVYYWRMNASNVAGSSAWSGTFSFTTIPAIPQAPVLATPANNATGIAVNPTMSWQSVSGATAYELQLSTSNTFAITIIDQKNLTGTSSAVSGLANNTVYYWRMNASNTAGAGAWSAAFSFTTDPGVVVPAAPTLIAPATGSTNVAVNPTMIWQAVSGATAYELQASTSNTFATIAIDQKNLTGTSSAVSGLANGTAYYWRMNASNTAGASAWSGTFNFTTVSGIMVPSAPTLATPATGSTNVAVNPTMIWQAVSGATAYELQVSTSNTFATVAIDQKNLTGTSSAVSGLVNNTVYYWRMNASNTAGASVWSATFSFTTALGVLVPAVPTLTAPANGSSNVAVNPMMTWQAAGGATAYELQLSTSNTFAAVVVDQKNLTGTSSTVSGLANNTVYYWRMNAGNTAGVSGWSATFSFTTLPVSSPQNAPNLISVMDVPRDYGRKVTLTWAASNLDVNATTLPFYSVWRKVSSRSGDDEEEMNFSQVITAQFQGRAYRKITIGGMTTIWQWVGNTMARSIPSYNFVAQTPYDSSSRTNGMQYFIVAAHTNTLSVFFDSNVDSGYSVANRRPHGPGDFHGSYDGGRSTFTWTPNDEPYISQYTIYRGTTPDNLEPIGTTQSADYVDAAAPSSQMYYSITAEDSSDNVSPLDTPIVPQVVMGTTEHGNARPSSFSLEQNSPNPFNPSTSIAFSLPARSVVTLEVYSILGQKIASLVDEVKEAGTYSVQWKANVSSGIYFYRLNAQSVDDPAKSFTQMKKMILMQ